MPRHIAPPVPRLLAAVALCALVLALLSAAPGPAGAVAEEPDAAGRGGASAEVSAAEAVPAGTALAKELRASGEGAGLYLVRLRTAPLATYAGGAAGLEATRPDVARGQRLDAQAPAVREYGGFLIESQDAVLAAVAAEVGRDLEPRFRYTAADNGFAVELTPDEAAAFALRPEVVHVQRDELRQLHTDNGPEWINAPAVYPAETSTPPQDGVTTRGEGMVVGVLDTGINPSNPSFAATGDDGYAHTNPLGAETYLGACDPENEEQFDPDFTCNDKLIGAWGFLAETTTAVDDDGHGSHTASTAAGNVVLDAEVFGPGVSTRRDIAGVAPHASVISYKVCETTAGCFTASITAAIDQAILDEVDVINYSIGSASPSDLYNEADTIGFLNARAAGIFVATSAGNAGPGEATVGSPADAPWMTSVGASTHDRIFANRLIDAEPALPDGRDEIVGKGFTGGLPPTPIVYAGDFGDALCQAGAFEPDTFDGRIVICDRGISGRVEKSQVVADAGAAGFVLANDDPNAATLNADAFAIPGVHVSYEDGNVLKDWLEAAGEATIAISGGAIDVDPAYGDVQAAFSSRAPNGAAEIVSPSVTAPGVDILAAVGIDDPQPPRWGFISGTSMASPHVAGVGALLADLHPEWSPAELQSAIMTTALTDVLEEDGETPADPFDYGSGRVDVGRADDAALVLDVTQQEYLDANPADGGDLKDLNLPSFANAQCLAECSWTRTVTSSAESGTAAVTWDAANEGDLDIAVEPASFTLAPGESQELTVTATTLGEETDAYVFDRVVLTPDAADVPAAALPVAVQPSDAILPPAVDIETRRDAGSEAVEDLQTVGFAEFGASASQLAPASPTEVSLRGDSTNTSPYDDLEDGVVVELVDVPAETARLVAEVTASTATDVDLFVGRDADGDGEPEATEQLCASSSPSFVEICDLLEPEEGSYWVLLQNWRPSAVGAVDSITYGTAVVASTGDADNLSVQGPDGPTETGEPFGIRVLYDEPALTAGRTWYGAVTIGDDLGTIPVSVTRREDDVVKTADVASAEPGGTITYTLEVRSNVTPEDLTYDIADELPEGVTYVEGSATGGAVVEDGTVRWSPVLETLVGDPGDYAVTTNAETGDCLIPFPPAAQGGGGYVDFAAFGIRPAPNIAGDGVLFTVSNGPAAAPYQFYGAEYDALSLTDDGYLLFGGPGNWWGSTQDASAEPQVLPDPALSNGVVAPLWDDWEVVYDGAEGRGVSIVNLGGTGPASTLIVDYAGVELPGDEVGPEDGAPTYDFQAWYRRSVSDAGGQYEIRYAYNDLGPLENPVTVGVEDPTGTEGSALVNGVIPEDGALTDDLIVCLDYQGPSAEPATATFQVTVDEDTPDRTLTNTAVHTTDDPGALPATASADVEVETSDDGGPGGPGEPGPGGPGDPGPGDGGPGDGPGDDGPGGNGPGPPGPGDRGPADGAVPGDGGTGDDDDSGPGDDGPPAAAPPALQRLAGDGRIQTAIEVSQRTYGSADTVLLARADAYPDALAGSPLSTAEAAPLLLHPVDSVDDEVAAEIERLGAERLVLLGGPDALSSEVAEGFRQRGLAVDRIGGASRFATAGLVADALGELVEVDEVAVVEGGNADPARGWPDALSASGLAASEGIPILLATADSLPEETAQRLGPDVDVLVVGGPTAVSTDVAAAINDAAGAVSRLSGATRYGTSAAVAEEALDRGLDLSTVWVATGLDFPDALTAGAAAGAMGTTLVLVDGQGLDASAETRDFLAARADTIDTLLVAGGEQAITTEVVARLEALTTAG